MSTVTLTMDAHTERELQALSDQEGIPVSEVALRLLRRAIRAKRPRPTFNVETVRALAAKFQEEDLALAESDQEHRAALLADEDTAA